MNFTATCVPSVLFLLIRPQPRSPLFSYTTLFRSNGIAAVRLVAADGAALRRDLIRVMTAVRARSEEHTSELQSQSNLVCRLLLEKKNTATCVPSVVCVPSQTEPMPPRPISCVSRY